MAHPYRTPPKRMRRARSPEGRLLKASVAFGCVCVVGGCVLSRSDSLPFAVISATVGGILIARRPRTFR